MTTSESKAALKLPREAIPTAMYIDGRHHANAECEFIARKRSGHGVPVAATARPRPHVDGPCSPTSNFAALQKIIETACAKPSIAIRLQHDRMLSLRIALTMIVG